MNLIEDHTQDISAGIRKENEDNNESYKCNICSKSLHSFSLLENHVERFHKTQRHNCDQCERTFQGKIPLQNHILQAHTSVKTFDCKHCGQSLSKKQSLNRHIQIFHLKERPNCFPCTQCTKAFRTQDLTIRHIKSAHDKNIFAAIYTSFPF